MPAIAAGFVLVGGAVASAHPAGDVPTSGEPGPGLLHAEVEYSYEADRAAITRERVGVAGADPQDALPRQRELDSHQTRQLVTPRLELAAYRGLWVSLAAPIVIAQTNEIDVADGVDRAAASTFIDGILPSTGFDASNPSVPPGGKVAFRGVTRRGVEAVRAGLGFAAMSQARDPTQPTWKLGAELALSVGRAMRFDAVHPDQQTGVASGVDQLRLWTAFDRRYLHGDGGRSTIAIAMQLHTCQNLQPLFDSLNI